MALFFSYVSLLRTHDPRADRCEIKITKKAKIIIRTIFPVHVHDPQ